MKPLTDRLQNQMRHLSILAARGLASPKQIEEARRLQHQMERSRASVVESAAFIRAFRIG